MARFLHIADVHLGFKQYGSQERLIDFAQAFKNAIKFGIEKKVDFIIIAGDLFHKKSEVDPLTLTQATKVLSMAKKAKIPVIAVEGNHDATYFKDQFSWMDYLAENGYLINLKPSIEDGIVLNEWDGRSGAYIDIDDTRIYGMKYYGSLTEKIIDEYAKKVEKKDFTIFVAHIGIEGYMNIYGCIPSTKLHRLKGKFDYIALGHIHKAFVEDFIFNPGSLETCDALEYKFERGAFLVELDDSIKYELVQFPRRKFSFLEHDFVSYDDFRSFLSKVNKNEIENSVLHLKLNANKSIKKMVDEPKIKTMVKEVVNPLIVKIKWNITDEIFTPILDLSAKKSIEMQVIEQLLESFPYGKIVDEILRLKAILSKSYDLKSVDEFVESILNLKEKKELNNVKVDSKEELKADKDLIKQDKVKKVEIGEEEWEWWKVNDTGS